MRSLQVKEHESLLRKKFCQSIHRFLGSLFHEPVPGTFDNNSYNTRIYKSRLINQEIFPRTPLPAQALASASFVCANSAKSFASLFKITKYLEALSGIAPAGQRSQHRTANDRLQGSARFGSAAQSFQMRSK